MTEAQLDWARRLQAIAQTGLHYTRDIYDRTRFEQVLEIAAEMLAPASEVPTLVKALSIETGYVTPKVGTRAVVVRDGKILLVRETTDGLWTLPGGWVDPGETPAQNCVREVREESGLEVRAVRLLAVYDRALNTHETSYLFHICKLFIHCEILGGELTTSDETTEVGFFDPAELPPLSLSRVTPAQIARCLVLMADASLPADFD